MINPNTKEFIHFPEKSFIGRCTNCNERRILSDTKNVAKHIEESYHEYVSNNKEQPLYASCIIVFKDNSDFTKNMLFKLSADVGKDDDDVFFYSNGIGELKSLAKPSANDFIIVELNTFF